MMLCMKAGHSDYVLTIITIFQKLLQNFLNYSEYLFFDLFATITIIMERNKIQLKLMIRGINF